MKSKARKSKDTRWHDLAVIGSAILITVAALFVVYKVGHTSVTPTSANANSVSQVPIGNSSQTEGLQTQSGNNQMVNGNSATQLQTGSSEVQQATPNQPQAAGTSNPVGPYYCDRKYAHGYIDCADLQQP